LFFNEINYLGRRSTLWMGYKTIHSKALSKS
jgi:hypothetical protein